MPTPVPHRLIATWLIVCAAMVAVMVMLGGATRLTESGLSMVHWKPLTVLPPLNATEWQTAFQDYQTSPEFVKKNSWMTVADFQSIYWLEFLHRLWGRLIGFAVFLPLVVLVARRAVDRPLAGKLAVLLVLGGLQGALGWFMVASGLVDRPDVSQYRLAAHLVSAFVLYGFIVWLVLDQIEAARPTARTDDPALARFAFIVPPAILLVVTAGAFVAGLDAGLVYNTFPLMDGGFTPPDGLALSPWYLNLFENVATVQFEHRVLAMSLVALIAGLWIYGRNRTLSARAHKFRHALLAMAVAQAILGISTLLLVVPIPLALTHQMGALALFTLSICFAHAVRPVAIPASKPLHFSTNPAE
jgi:cytochrome c oxidase assembly protein subunit 15